MLKLKYLTRFSLVALIAFMATVSPIKLMAQDDSDEDTFVPTTSSSTPPESGTPPVIIDESDSSGVSDVEEYDG